MHRSENPDRVPGHSLPELVEVMRRLLAPDGCPWDREQSLDSLIPFLIEETYEVVDAIESGDPAHHCEELGDLLMQIVFQAALRQGEGGFDIDDVVAGIRDKLIRRHPHVFGDSRLETADQVLDQWQRIKAEEARARGQAGDERGSGSDAEGGGDAGRPRALAGVPAAMPAMLRAQALSAKAAKVGFDWPDSAGCMDKVREELAEIADAIADADASEDADASGDQARIEAEVGDLLFAAVSLARKLGCDAERALRHANQRFCQRFEYVEARLHERGRSPRESTLDEMDALWNQAKARRS